MDLGGRREYWPERNRGLELYRPAEIRDGLQMFFTFAGWSLVEPAVRREAGAPHHLEAHPAQHAFTASCRALRWFELALAAAILCLATSRADDRVDPIVRGIGDVVVLTPSGAAGAPKRLYSEYEVSSWLEGLVGKPFDRAGIERAIARRYEYLGYEPSIHLALEREVLGVTIVEAPCVIEEIALGPDALSGHVDPDLLESLLPIERPHVLARALRTRHGDLLNHERLARDEHDLAHLGYDIVPVPPYLEGAGRRGKDRDAASQTPGGGAATRFAVVPRPRLAAWREARDRMASMRGGRRPGGAGEGGEPYPAAEARNKEVDAGPDVPARQPGLPGALERAEDSSPPDVAPGAGEDARIRPPIDPLRLSWIDTEVEYTRRELLVARLFYQRANLFREFDSFEVSPYVAQQIAGALRYRLSYILPATVTEWNLFADVKLYDEFVPDRLLDGVETDERRAGARVAMGLEPFAGLRGHSLSATGWVDRYHVTFGEFQIPINGGIAPRSAEVPGGRLNDVNVVGVEARWAYHHEFRAPRFWLEIRPRAEIATKALGGDVSFKRVSGELRQHHAWSSGLELDTSWKGGVVDRDAPLFEEFSLGGASSLRGFLRDDFLGRRYWSAQHDLWVPIPFRAFAPGSALMATLQRNLKTALILDAGSVSYEETLDVRFARGAGIGLRWQAEGSPLVVRADAAWGFWRGQRRFYPYLSFTRAW